MGSGVSKGGGDSAASSPAKTGSGTAVSVHFRHGPPAVPFDEAIGCFKAVGHSNRITRTGAMRSVTTTSQPGYLYRLVNRTTRQWHFYNDTTTFDFTVTGYFGPSNVIRPLGSAKMFREMPSGLVIVEMTVGPLETLPYIEGDVKDGFDINFAAASRKSGVASRSGANSYGHPASSIASTTRVPVMSADDGLTATNSVSQIRPVSCRPAHSAEHNALSFCPNCHATTLVTTTVPSSPAPASLEPPPAPSAFLSTPARDDGRKSPSITAVNGDGRGEHDNQLTVSTDRTTSGESRSNSNAREEPSVEPVVLAAAAAPDAKQRTGLAFGSPRPEGNVAC